MEVRLLVCGGRAFMERERAFSILDTFHSLTPVGLLIEGGAKGADAIAREWAAHHGISCVTFKADWTKHGRSAGPIRNREMLELGKPSAAIAFPGGSGTADMVKLLRKANIPTNVIVDLPRD
jgi:YspA, cpYpsA-related SLOG family